MTTSCCNEDPPQQDTHIGRGHGTRHIKSCDVMPSPYADAPERAEKALASATRRVFLIMMKGLVNDVMPRQ